MENSFTTLFRKQVLILRDQFFQSLNKFISWDHSCTQTFEVFGIDLAVDQFNSIIFQMFNKFYKSIFACITLFAEHTFAKKYFSNSYSIQTTYQFAIFPNFSAVSKTKFVQNCVC